MVQIYAIRNEQNEVIYVGSAFSAKNRYKAHKLDKRGVRGKKTKLEILEEVEDSLRRVTEFYWINKLSEKYKLLNKQLNSNSIYTDSAYNKLLFSLGRRFKHLERSGTQSSDEQRGTSSAISKTSSIRDIRPIRTNENKTDSGIDKEYSQTTNSRILSMQGDSSTPRILTNDRLVELYNEFHSSELMSLSEETKKKQILGLITSILRERIKK